MHGAWSPAASNTPVRLQTGQGAMMQLRGVDASPEVALVRFPDGYLETFANTYVIPRIAYGIAK